MPWETILTAAGGASLTTVIIIILFLQFVDRMMGKAIDGLHAQFQSQIKQAEDAFASSLRRAEAAYTQALSFNTQVDVHLREKRLAVYAELWQITQVLPKWPRAIDVTYEKLSQFSQDLQDWYFKKGGMFFSEETKDAYVALQDGIWDILKASPKGKISDPHYDAIRDLCSTMRTQITEDILSRRPPPAGQAVSKP